MIVYCLRGMRTLQAAGLLSEAVYECGLLPPYLSRTLHAQHICCNATRWDLACVSCVSSTCVGRVWLLRIQVFAISMLASV